MRQLRLSKSVTDRSNNTLDIYINEINKYKLLSPEEEILLAIKIKDGDQTALDKLINSNLRFVISVAKQYQNQGLELMDLISEGNQGLIKAAKKFDETRGFKFVSFAVWFIRQAIINALSSQSRVVRLPLNRLSMLSKVNKAINALQQRDQHDPPLDMIAEEAGLSIKEVSDTLSMSETYVSLDAPLDQEGEDSSLALIDIIEDDSAEATDEVLRKESLYKELERSLSTLSEKERDVVSMFYGIGYPEQLSLDEISEEVGLTRERARQIKEKAVRKLRHHSRSHLLKQFL